MCVCVDGGTCTDTSALFSLQRRQLTMEGLPPPLVLGCQLGQLDVHIVSLACMGCASVLQEM